VHSAGGRGCSAKFIDDFIRAAGVSRGTFYNYFRTTGELLEATISSLKDDAIRAVDPQISRIDDVVLRLATAIRLHLRWAASDPDRCAFIAKIPQSWRAISHPATRSGLWSCATGSA
jgi:AcrR family transcriptional regulator